jgi:pimeloyl-ACP methyl ester carboxylesterase
MWIAAVATWKRLSWWTPIVALMNARFIPVSKALARTLKEVARLDARVSRFIKLKVLAFLVKVLVIGNLLNLVAQDVFLPPSRVSMTTLLNHYFLPSKLSKYETVTLPSSNGAASMNLGVHFLEYKNSESDNHLAPTPAPTSVTSPSKYHTLYLNHGFGASSLSWLPALPQLAKRCQLRTIIGHDAPGFGFTHRPETRQGFTAQTSADIGMQLLATITRSGNGHDTLTKTTNSTSPIILMGHSMGCRTTLRMATQLPPEQQALIVLVAPALGLHGKRRNNGTNNRKGGIASGIGSFVTRNVVEPPLMYGLKRLVGYVLDARYTVS